MKTLHDSWLSWWEITSKRLPDGARDVLEKHIQGAFYAGAFFVVSSETSKEEMWRMCEGGMADACGRPMMKLVDEKGRTFQERKAMNGAAQ